MNRKVLPSLIPIVPLSIAVMTLAFSAGRAADDAGVYWGAKMPFTTVEAEASANKTTGTVVTVPSLTEAYAATPALEASGRSFVELTAPEQYLEIPNTPEVNAIVLRHCIPDAPTGGGEERTLSLYVNGKFRQKITLTSKYTWLYGEEAKNGQSNDPAAGVPHVFWDDGRYLIEGGLKQGDTLRLQKDSGDTADFYRIDLVDLEVVPPALEPPAKGTYLSVADYGANGSDEDDDTAAIRKCVEEAKAQRKTVWLPAGNYYQSEKITLDGVTVQGAGMWYTYVTGTVPGKDFAGTLGFHFAGDGSRVSDMTMASTADTSRSRFGNKPFTAKPFTEHAPVTNWAVENVWIVHTNVGLWMSGVTNGLVRGCRLYMLYADGINMNRGSSNNVLEHNYVRGIGDDGVVTLSTLDYQGTPDAISTANIIRHNTVVAIWWGHNCSVSGGSDHVAEYNYFADNSRIGCLTINLSNAYPKYPSKNNQLRNNMIVRGGGNHDRQRRGAIWVNAGSATIANAQFRDNIIIDPVFRGIHIRGAQKQECVFENNVILRPGEDGIVIEEEAKGSGTFTGNTVEDVKQGKEFENEAGAEYEVKAEDNSWQKGS